MVTPSGSPAVEPAAGVSVGPREAAPSADDRSFSPRSGGSANATALRVANYSLDPELAEDARVQELFALAVGAAAAAPPPPSEGAAPRSGASERAPLAAPASADGGSGGGAAAAAALPTFATEGELLDALQRRVDSVLGRLYAGGDFDVADGVDEAIVRRGLAKAQPPEVATAAAAEALESERLPPLIGPTRDLFPNFEFDGGSCDDAELEERVSTNAPGGIRPYVPPPGALQRHQRLMARRARAAATTANASFAGSSRPASPLPPLSVSGDDGTATAASAVAGECALGDVCDGVNNNNNRIDDDGAESTTAAASTARGGWRVAAALRALLRGRCGGYPRVARIFCLWALLAATVYSLVVAAVYHAAPLRVCGGGCRCSSGEAAALAFSYQLLTALPRCVFFALLLHVLLWAEKRAAARRSAAAGDGPPTLSAAAWDLPPLRSFLRLPSLWRLSAARFALYTIADTQADTWGLPRDAWVPVRFAALALPLVAFAANRRRPTVAVPLLIAEAFPFAMQLLFPHLGASASTVTVVFALGWPALVLLIERAFFYLLARALPEWCPAAVKVTLALAHAFYALALVACLMLYVDLAAAPRAVGVLAQVVVFELLAGTVLIDRLWMWAVAQYRVRVQRAKPAARPLQPRDFRCLATQVRWAAAVLLMLALLPAFVANQWPARTGGSDCHRRVVLRPHGVSYAAMGCAYLLAGALTAIFRWRNDSLRPPLVLCSRPLCLATGLYLAMLVPTAVSFSTSHELGK